MAGSRPRVVATIEARMTSSRLPGKVLMPAGGVPLLQVLIERLRRAQGIDEIVVATTANATDEPIVALAQRLGVGVFRGSEEDVLDRVCGALRPHGADICVEITGDCPLVDPAIVTEMIGEYLKTRGRHSYVSNSDPHRSVPAGLDVQVFAAEALYRLAAQTNDPDDREHVSYGFYRPESEHRWNPRFITHASCAGGQDCWVSLDYQEDYELIKALHEEVSTRAPQYGAKEIIDWLRRHPQMHDRCLMLRRTRLA